MDKAHTPTDKSEEDFFLILGPVKLSVRQMLILFLGILLCYGAADMLFAPILGLAA